MSDYNDKNEKKGGFLSTLSGIFRGGSSAMGGASSSGLGSAGGLGGLFATKAGIVGMVLGGATIAAGVGVVYNFVGSSSKPVYSPELFQNSYYEEESNEAGLARARAKDSSGAAASTLDMFSEQAKKDGLSGLAAEAGGDSDKSADSKDSSAGAPAGAAADASAGAPAAGGAASATNASKLQASHGFGGDGGGGGSGSAMPRMQGGGGLSGGIGNQFASMYKAPAGADGGKTSGMSAMAARMKNAPKYAVPNFNKKGAMSQAKFAGKLGAKAAYSSDGAGARSMATEAFSGETAGSGDVAGGGGAGLGGAGVSNGANLKGNDPSLNTNSSSVPTVPDPTKDNPWQKYEDDAMNSMLWAAGLVIVAKIMHAIAKKLPGWWSIGFEIAAIAAAIAAIVFAVKVLMDGIALMKGDPNGNPPWQGQTWMGVMYIAAGAMLILQAIQAISDACSDPKGSLSQGFDKELGKGLEGTLGKIGGVTGDIGGIGSMFKGM